MSGHSSMQKENQWLKGIKNGPFFTFITHHTFSQILGGKASHIATPKSWLKIPHKTTCEVLFPLLCNNVRENFFLLSFKLTIFSSLIKSQNKKIFSIQYCIFVLNYLQLNLNSTFKILVFRKKRRKPGCFLIFLFKVTTFSRRLLLNK